MMNVSAKRRFELNSSSSLLTENWSYGSCVNRSEVPYRLFGFQKTASESHVWPPKRSKRKKVIVYPDSGGGFTSYRSKWDGNGAEFDEWFTRSGPVEPGNKGSFVYHYKGKIYPFKNTNQVSDYGTDLNIVGSTDREMDAWGAILVSRALPTNPLANLGQFLGELRKDGIPKLPFLGLMKEKTGQAVRAVRAARRHGKELSDEYLNIQFGWMPFISDIKDLFHSISNWSQLANQYESNSGKRIKRRRSFAPLITTTTETMAAAYGYGTPTMVTYGYKAPGTLTKSTITRVDRWFSGAFTYYLPKTNSPWKKFARQAGHILGLKLTPELLWSLAPWTWAVDWFVNVKPLLRNWQAFCVDGLIMHYGYAMETTTVLTEYALNGLTLVSGRKINAVQQKVQTLKRRRRATPFGFGLVPGNFSSFQWSIVAALGISKAPRSLSF